MEHLTAEQIIDFVSADEINEKSIQNIGKVNAHITECEECLQKVRAFQLIYDEFLEIYKSKASGKDLYEFFERHDCANKYMR